VIFFACLKLENNKDISLVVSSLQSKVEKLILKHRKASEETKQLKEDNEFLRKALQMQKVDFSKLEEKTKVLKLAKSISGIEGKNTEVKLKINELVREIDRCIALVNK
jgi:vacuolar-type H+-ATPase subunit C/Vma6